MSRIPPRRRARSDTGQALVEMALVTPILLLMILGLIDFARAWNLHQVITDAGREGARTVVVDWEGLTPTQKRNKSYEVIGAALARAGVDPSHARICVGQSPTPCAEIDCLTEDPCAVRIELDYAFGLIGPFWRLADPDGEVTLSTQFVMRTE